MHQPVSIIVALSLGAALLCSGCAWHYQDIRLVSNPSGAKVKVEMHINSWALHKTTTLGESTTPCVVNVPRGPHEIIVTFEQEGCSSIRKTYLPTCDAGKYAAGFLFVGTGPAYSFPAEITAELAPMGGISVIGETWK